MNLRLWSSILAILVSAEGLAFAQTTPVPANFRDLYSTLDQSVSAFARTVSSQAGGQKSPVAWSAELLTANCNRGRALLDPATHEMIRQELDRLQSLGVKAVTVCIGFPVLYQPFYEFSHDTEDYRLFLKFYRDLAADIHARGLKLIVESSILYLRRESRFDLAGYYASLQSRQLIEGRAQNIVTIAKELQPDFLNLGSEPDTQAAISKQPVFKSASGYGDIIGYFVKQLRQAGVTGIPIGAGIGTWQRDGDTFVKALLNTGIDYLDLHVYPVRPGDLDKAITYADMAHAAGKQVAMSQVWLLKMDGSEWGRVDPTTDPTFYARDRFGFWAPLDQKFLGALIQYANWKKLLYFSPFWSRYFWSYVDYDPSGETMPANAAMQQASRAAMNGMQARKLTATGEFYKNSIAGR